MVASYRSQFKALAEGVLAGAQELLFSNELVYVARKTSP
jgi:hypothetical protein